MCFCAGSQDALCCSLPGNRLYMPSLGRELLSVIAREAPQEIPNSLFCLVYEKCRWPCSSIAEIDSPSYLLSYLRVLLSLVKKGIFKSHSSPVIKSEYEYAGFSSFVFEIRSYKNLTCHNNLKCLSLPVEIICLSCCHLQGVQGLGVVMSLINTLIENLWRAEQHLPTRLMLVLLPLFILTLTAACTVCTSGTRTRLATAMHGNWWKFMKIAQAKGIFLKLFDFPIKHNWVMRGEKKLLLVGLFCITSWAVPCTLQVWVAGGNAVLAGFCSQQGSCAWRDQVVHEAVHPLLPSAGQTDL